LGVAVLEVENWVSLINRSLDVQVLIHQHFGKLLYYITLLYISS
jgi:hypothetical protein